MFPDLFTTARLVLRPVAAADAEAIFVAYAQDPEVTRHMIWRPHRTIDDTLAYVGDCMALHPEAARVYALVARDAGTLFGSLHLRRPAPHRVEAGYVLARPQWGRGLMTEALQAAVGWTLAQPDLFRFAAVCDVDNPASARVMEKAGLTREGVLKRFMLHPNLSAEPRDCFIYAAVR